jgi:exodeoxyribonuclease V beta subunit
MAADQHTEDGRDVADPQLIPEVKEVRVARRGFRGFPGGIQPGNALHAILERVDLRKVAEPGTRERVQRTLQSHNILGDAIEAEQRVTDVCTMLDTVAGAKIPGTGFTLGDVPYRAGMREWRFQLSVRSVSARRIAEVLAEYGSAHARAYAPILRTLREHTVRGYLSGSVDLAFEHDGRWWLLDWKSNWLGDGDADYAPSALGAAMMGAHYTLQYHLYLLALHRHLQWRQPGYDPAAHWGGVAYVFLRGIRGTGDDGWFRDQPTPGLLEGLDAALGRRP